MRVTLVAVNAMYQHTSLALRLLSKAAEGLPLLHTPLELHINMRDDALLRAVYETKPDVLCFSCYIWNITIILRLVKDMKKLLPSIRIVLGGPEVSYDAHYFLSSHPEIDAIVCGEGEISYPTLLRAYLSGDDAKHIPGVWTRGIDPGAFMPSDPVPLNQTLPAYEAADSYDPQRIWYAETSRGCPFACKFCLSSIQPGVRALDAPAAATLLCDMAAKGATLLKLVDRTFNFDRKRAIAIWKALLETKDCVFHFEIEPSLLDEETLSFLAAVPKGKFQFEIGIQSTNSDTLRHIARRLDMETVRGVVSRLRSYGTIPLHLDLIAGLPLEDMASFEQSVNTVFSFSPTVLQIGFVKLLRGSALRRQADQYGIVYSDAAPYEVLYTPNLSQDDILLLKDIAMVVDWYFNSKRYPASMALLLLHETPFARFRQIATHLRKNDIFSAPRTQAQRLAALYRAGQASIAETLAPYLPDAICFDALTQNIAISLLPDEITEVLQTPRESMFLKRKFPEYAKRREYSLVQFAINIPRLLLDGVLIAEENHLLIHRKKGAYQVWMEGVDWKFANEWACMI